MDYVELKQQVVTELEQKLNAILHDVEPKVIKHIINLVKTDYEEIVYEQKLEIDDLKKRVQDLEETISWIAHKLGTKI